MHQELLEGSAFDLTTVAVEELALRRAFDAAVNR
jgi:hypothetical protein